jgi:hypothetical protein
VDNTLESSKNGKDPTKRYNTEEIEEIESEDPFLGTSCGKFSRYIFSQDYEQLVNLVSTLDVLVSLPFFESTVADLY